MTSVDVLNETGAKAGSVDLPDEIFDVQVNIPLIHQVVVGQQAAARQGTHATKTRGQVRGGGAKPYRQKGTGRARQGSRRAPQFAGGGVVHGPHPRSYDQRTPKKMKAAALRGALSDRARNGRVHVVTGLVDTELPSTKAAAAAIAAITSRRHVLVVLDRDDELSWKSLRNVPNVHLIVPDQLNTYDVLTSDDLVFTAAAFQEFSGIEVVTEKAPTKKAAAKKTAKKAEASDADEGGETDATMVEAAPAKKAAAKKATAKKTAKKAADKPAAKEEEGDE